MRIAHCVNGSTFQHRSVEAPIRVVSDEQQRNPQIGRFFLRPPPPPSVG